MKSPRKQFWFNKNDPSYLELVQAINRVFWNGYSVVNIARILAHKNASRVYRIMRENGLLPVMIRQAHKYELPFLFKGCLSSVDLGFPQWCNSHGIEDCRRAAEIITFGLSDRDESNKQIFQAFYDDFPKVFSTLYLKKTYLLTLVEQRPRPTVWSPKFSTKCEYSPSESKYFMTITPEVGEPIIVSGATIKVAVSAANTKIALLLSILKLNSI